MHAVREQVIDLPARTHQVVSRVFPIEQLELGEHGLYLARPVLTHPRIAYMRSHYLPALGIIASRFTCHDDSPYLEWYVDVAEIHPGQERWLVRDYYLDVEVTNDGVVQVTDTGEYLAAVAEGHLTSAEAEFALTVAHDTLNGILAHGSLEAWLAARGIILLEPQPA